MATEAGSGTTSDAKNAAATVTKHAANCAPTTLKAERGQRAGYQRALPFPLIRGARVERARPGAGAGLAHRGGRAADPLLGGTPQLRVDGEAAGSELDALDDLRQLGYQGPAGHHGDDDALALDPARVPAVAQ